MLKLSVYQPSGFYFTAGGGRVPSTSHRPIDLAADNN